MLVNKVRLRSLLWFNCLKTHDAMVRKLRNPAMTDKDDLKQITNKQPIS